VRTEDANGRHDWMDAARGPMEGKGSRGGPIPGNYKGAEVCWRTRDENEEVPRDPEGPKNGRGSRANAEAMAEGRRPRRNKGYQGTPPGQQMAGGGKYEQLGAQMGPTVAKTEIGLALSRGPRFQTANRGDARAEGSDLGAAGLLAAG
jgi:hypothetical protein